MPKDIDIELYLETLTDIPLIDVRSPGEYAKGHISGAINIPLFSNEERAHIGTVYKQESQEKAMELGYKYVDPKLQYYVDESRKAAPDGKIIIHCWRGGMRSHAFAEHLEKNGFNEVYVIEKGYKAYRTLAVSDYDKGELIVLGGYTGSGKTHILHELKKLDQQVVDLEGLANHKGSAFGRIGMGDQPTTEQFENNLYWQWRKLDLSQPIWIEDESANIGDVNMPHPLYYKIRKSQLFFLDIKREERASLLVEDYSIGQKEKLARCIQRIGKRLGSANTKNALESLERNDFYEVAMITLTYYDKYYKKGMSKRDPEKIRVIPLKDTNPTQNAKELIKFINNEQHRYKTNPI